MSKWIWISLSVVAIFAGCMGVYIYKFAGLGYYLKSLRIIDQLPTAEEKEATWNEFKGPDPKWVYGGILAGSFMDKIWVWGDRGLQAFTVDENSVYSWYDGCNNEVLAQLNQGASGKVISREITTTLDDWRKRAQVGDYVRVNLTKPNTGGVVGNLRELYTYNFWLFRRAGMEVRCAK